MQVTVKTKEGKVIFTDIDPGMNMDIVIPPEEVNGVQKNKGTRVSLSTTPFREIKSTWNSNSITTYVNQPEDDMVRVMVHIDYRDHKTYVTLVDKEVPICTKKVKFKDTSGYLIVTQDEHK